MQTCNEQIIAFRSQSSVRVRPNKASRTTCNSSMRLNIASDTMMLLWVHVGLEHWGNSQFKWCTLFVLWINKAHSAGNALPWFFILLVQSGDGQKGLSDAHSHIGIGQVNRSWVRFKGSRRALTLKVPHLVWNRYQFWRVSLVKCVPLLICLR